MGAEKLLSVACLRNGVVAFPLQKFWSIAVVDRAVVVVSALEHFPVIESVVTFGRNKGQTFGAVEMPFADVTSVVTGRAKNFCKRGDVGGKPCVVQKHAMGGGALPGHDGGACWTADRDASDCVDEPNALLLEPVEVRSFGVWVAGKAEGLRAPLIRKNKEDVWVRRTIGGKGREGDGADCECQREWGEPSL